MDVGEQTKRDVAASELVERFERAVIDNGRLHLAYLQASNSIGAGSAAGTCLFNEWQDAQAKVQRHRIALLKKLAE